MKNITIAVSVTLIIGLSSCTHEKGNGETTDCIECTGCFGNWRECEADWLPTDSTSWEQHMLYMTTQTTATFSCTRTN